MQPREILLYLSMKHSGDWNAIYNSVVAKEECDDNEVAKSIKECESKFITILDDEYPESLRQVTKPPFVLFYHGDISLISDKNNKIAVVGSRDNTQYGEDVTNKFVSYLAKDFVIISGLARGIDGIAHRCAINAGGKTVAVIGQGINVCYLEQNEDIYEECKKNHLVISEYPNSVSPSPWNFPIRNRIIAGLCDTLLITEGKINSGTQITALLMVEKDGNVCCVPTRAGEDSICNHLISDGAYLVETPEDIYDITHIVSKRTIF